METTTYIALSRQDGLRRQLDIIANNLANMNTNGFKGEKMMFAEHLVRSRGGYRPIADKIAYVRDIATVRDMSEGPLQSTGNPLDLAINGEGFFTLETDQGEAYTRNGRFQLDQEGQLVNQRGESVLSDGGQPFFFGPDDKNIVVARDGTISTNNGDVGRLAIVQFAKPQDLRPGAAGQFYTEQDPQAVETPILVQGMLEGSNVQPITEMTKMIELQRTYESVRKFMEKEDERVKGMIQTMVRAA